jgi:hypothetical protein
MNQDLANKNLCFKLPMGDYVDNHIGESQVLKRRFPPAEEIFHPSKKVKKKLYDPHALISPSPSDSFTEKINNSKNKNFKSFFEDFDTSSLCSIFHLHKLPDSNFGNSLVPKNPFKH